jgi:hypothetical protein
MKKSPKSLNMIKTLSVLSMLTFAALACTSFISSPIATLPAPTVNAPVLPTAEPSTGSTEGQTNTLGVDIPIAGAQHIEEGVEATDWNSDPPTSGQHFARWAQSGFYDEAIPDGYLVHAMEHGYIIVYFNCGAVSVDCDTFKSEIETAIAAAGNDPNTNTIKLTAVPRPSMTNPITYASWGHLYKADLFVPDELVLYVQTYRSNPDCAPEWSLP